MKIIYIIWRTGWEHNIFMDAYSSIDKAETALEDLYDEDPDISYEIEEYEVL